MTRNVIGFFLFLASILFVFAVLLPKLQQVREITIAKEATLRAVELQQQRTAALATLQQSFKTQADRVAAITAVLPDDPGYASALIALEAIVRESGLSVQSYAPQSRPGDNQVVIALRGEGELGQIESFATKAAQHSRPISLGAAQIIRQTNGKLAFTLTFVLPYSATAKEAK